MLKTVALLVLLAVSLSAQENCPIGSYSGKGFVGTLNFDSEGLAKLDMLNQMILRCKVIVNVTQSFTRSRDPYNIKDEDMHLFIGRGINFELLDDEGKLLCDKQCLASKPLPESSVDCFLSKLGDHYSYLRPGVFSFKTYSSRSIEDLDLLEKRQFGCQLRIDLPIEEAKKEAVKVQAPVTTESVEQPSRLVGAWKLVDSENWVEFLKAYGIGWMTRNIVKNIKPDVYIENSGKNWTVSIKSTFKSFSSTYTEGVKTNTVSPMDDVKGELLARREGKDRLIEEQVDFTKPIRKIRGVREINAKGQMVHTMYINDVVCKRIYDRMN